MAIKIEVNELGTKIKTIPGISDILAGTILAETGDIHRFKSYRAYVSFAGLDAIVKQSGESISGRNSISKKGSTRLRTSLYRATVTCIGKDNIIDEYFKKKKEEGKHGKIALVSCSRKLAGIVYAVLKSNTEYIRR